MTEPPPEVVPPQYWEIWYAACRLLEQNAGLTILSKYAEIGEDKCDNSLIEQERDSREAHGVDAYPFPPCPSFGSGEGRPSGGRTAAELSSVSLREDRPFAALFATLI